MPRMSGVLRRIRGRVRDDRGGVATIVAVLLAGGVLLGLTAVVVDVGKLYAEREELQSGADAAAMAIALDCAKGRAECSIDGAPDTATGYANDNARDNLSDADVVCGHAPGRLLACTHAPVGNATDCLGEPPTTGNWVEVRTTTRVSNDSTILPPSFAQALVGGYEGTTVAACARVGWGSPTTGFPLTFSLCEYNLAVAAGDVVVGDPVPGNEVILYTHGSKDAHSCKPSPSGANLPGGFGWVVPDSTCTAVIVTDGTYPSKPGDPVPNECRDVLRDVVDARTPVTIPIFDEKGGVGNNGWYGLNGVAAFVITGYNLPAAQPKSRPSWLTGNSLCKGNDHCVYGYFTEALMEWEGSFGTAPVLGAVVVKTLG